MFLGVIHLFLVNSIVNQPDSDTFPTEIDRGQIPMGALSPSLRRSRGQFSDALAAIGLVDSREAAPPRRIHEHSVQVDDSKGPTLVNVTDEQEQRGHREKCTRSEDALE